MALPTPEDVALPTPEEIEAQFLATVVHAEAARDVEANVEEGSDHWVRARAIAPTASIAIQNYKLSNADRDPLTATDEKLKTMASVFGVEPRAASSAAGFLVATVTSGGFVTIPQGHRWAAPNGETYTTITANLVSDGDEVEVIAEGTGTATNQDAGTVGQWTSAAVVGLSTSATVSSAKPIEGGEAADDDEKLRARFLRRLRFPAVGDNWAAVAQWAEESTASVSQAFVYPAVRGPSSFNVAVVSDSGERTLAPSVVNTVGAYVLGKANGTADIVTTSVEPVGVDVVIDLSLPLPQSAGGAGGGWKDSAPWPDTTAGVAASQSGTPTLTFADANPDTITRSTGSWITDRFMAGMTIVVTNTVSNNGSFVIASATDTLLTLTSAAALTPETVVGIAAGSVTSADSVPVRVVAKSGNTMTVTSHSSNAPSAGKRFAIWDRTNDEMLEFAISSVSGSSGAYVITVDAGQSSSLANVEIGAYVSAAAVNLGTYAAEWLALVEKLGPDELTSSSDILPRGARRPGPDVEAPVGAPYSLGGVQLGALTAAHTEILDLSYGARLEHATSTTATRPGVALSTSDPPNIFVLRHIAFRKA